MIIYNLRLSNYRANQTNERNKDHLLLKSLSSGSLPLLSFFKVEFSVTSGSKLASNIALIERNRLRGWVAILREGKGYIEQSNPTGNIEPIIFSTNAFTGDNAQIDLGDEVEFSLRKISGRLTAENILKVSSTVNNFYVCIL
jgi:hypothetical protein